VSSLSLYDAQAELCKAFGHPVRFIILHQLRNGPKRISDLAQITGLKKGAVSRHLAVLRNREILAAHSLGKDVFYQIADPRISDLCDLLRQILVEQAARRSQVLKTFTEEKK
jgi:ArsR family transcriptional regulator